MSYINLAAPTYQTLASYGVLAGATITAVGPPVTNIADGFYGSTNSTYVTPGVTFTGTLNQANVGTGQSQLTTLVSNIVNNTLPIDQKSATHTSNPNVNFLRNKITVPISTDPQHFEFTDCTLVFDAQGDANSQFFIVSPSYVTITRCTFSLQGGTLPCNIFIVATGDVGAGYIEITQTNQPISGILIANQYITIVNSNAGTTNVTGHLYAQTGAISLTQVSDVYTTTCDVGNEIIIVCYTKGTHILTKNGYKLIENITLNDKIVTKGKIYNNLFTEPNSKLKLEHLLWISKFKPKQMNKKSRPICIKKHALGNNYPIKDLYVSPGHNIIIKNKMFLAKDLVNGSTIYQDNDCKEVEYYHLELESHSAIFANGLLAESYLDVNNRGVFEPSPRLRLNKQHRLNKLNYI